MKVMARRCVEILSNEDGGYAAGPEAQHSVDDLPLGAAGGIEAIASLLALRHGVLPPTINYTTPDPECDLDYIPNQARKVQVEYALSNNLGFGGHNASVIFKQYTA